MPPGSASRSWPPRCPPGRSWRLVARFRASLGVVEKAMGLAARRHGAARLRGRHAGDRRLAARLCADSRTDRMNAGRTARRLRVQICERPSRHARILAHLSAGTRPVIHFQNIEYQEAAMLSRRSFLAGSVGGGLALHRGRRAFAASDPDRRRPLSAALVPGKLSRARRRSGRRGRKGQAARRSCGSCGVAPIAGTRIS